MLFLKLGDEYLAIYYFTHISYVLNILYIFKDCVGGWVIGEEVDVSSVVSYFFVLKWEK